MDSVGQDIKRKCFVLGALLAWGPWVVFFYQAAGSISSNKATGLGAVAGGLPALFIGSVGVLVVEVSAIVLLLRASSRGNSTRTGFAVLSICVSLLMISIFGF